MKRRTKKILVNEPMALGAIKFDDLDDEAEDLDSLSSDAKSRRFKDLRKRNHNSFTAIHFRHLSKNPRGRDLSS